MAESQDRDRDRDRDRDGRARQSRPRDHLGRPLPYGTAGADPVPPEPLPPRQTLDLAGRLLGEGRPFAAHEVLENRWKTCPPHERDLWQGLAQLSVGLTHAQRGNPVGAARLVERGARLLGEVARSGGPNHGLDVAAVVACARARVAPDSGAAVGREGDVGPS
ncbi:MAG TPA: DUF309 domain-containing protein [Dermatophilaceae bacterium]|nr:DUF309 domain-containing protein [Dermatophilaceae bacterium]